MTENVQVAVRVRPFNEREKALGSTPCIRMVKETQQTIITDPETNADKVFTFDYSYNSFASPDDPEHASQDTVWDDIGIKVLEHAWNGFNVSLFAYGQTGAGKSFSMVGYGSDKGIIPRASEVIFQRIDANDAEVTFKVEASMMEIYNERVKDLFNPAFDNLKVRDHPRQGPYAEGLTRSAVASHAEINRLMDAGILARTTASTNMNATSSRAHTIFQIIVTQSEPNPSTGKVMEKVSRINLIDLAGSERATSTGATGARLKEGAAINQSLSALGNCISALADIANGKKKVLVPYRNSKLTHLLKDSLGGNSKTIMIAALSPASVNYSETLSTLRYADRAKQIKNQAIVNEDPNQMLIRQLKEELENLRRAMMENSDARPRSRGVDAQGLGGELGTCTPPPDTARQQEVAAIREQLEEHQRLLQESEKTWAERLKETEDLARQREEQLKLLGLVTNAEDLKERCAKEPHLLNLHEDQVMSEKLRYFIRQGENRVGRVDAETEQRIVIGGLGILKEHCVIISEDVTLSAFNPDSENIDKASKVLENPVTKEHLLIRPVGAAKVFINAVLVNEGQSVELHHNDRLVLGNSNVFRVVIPSARLPNISEEEVLKESQLDWQLAIKELHNSQLKASQELEAIAEREKHEMDTRVKLMEEKMQEEKKQAEDRLVQQRKEWEDHVRQLNEQMKVKEDEIKSQMQSEEEQDKKRLAEQLALQEAKLAEELVKAEILFEKKQLEMVERQKELEVTLQKQMWEAKLLSRRKDRERLERLKFDDQLLTAIPLINEANSIAEELERSTCFSLQLIASGPHLSAFALEYQTADEEEDAIVESIIPELKVQVNFQEAGTFRSVLWDIDLFHANMFTMREMYQAFIENNRTLSAVTAWQEDNEIDSDPFYEPPQPQMIGKSFVFLNNLVYGCKITESTPIYDIKGQQNGNLRCEITPSVLSHEWQAQQHRLVDECPADISQLELPTLKDFMGANLRINIFIEQLRGIPGKLCKDAHVKFRWTNARLDSQLDEFDQQSEEYASDPAPSPSVDPQINFHIVLERQITMELIDCLLSYPLELSVFGIVPSSNLNKVASRAIDMRSDSTPTTSDTGDENSNIMFFDADSSGQNKLSGKKQSMRRRKGRYLSSEEDVSVLLEQCKEQLLIQGKTLDENTQELERKTLQAIELQQALANEQATRRHLEEALENMMRTNKLIQTKLQQQILKDAVSTTPSERKLQAVVDAARIPIVSEMTDQRVDHCQQLSGGESEKASTMEVSPHDMLHRRGSKVRGDEKPSGTSNIDYKALGFSAHPPSARRPSQEINVAPSPSPDKSHQENQHHDECSSKPLEDPSTTQKTGQVSQPPVLEPTREKAKHKSSGGGGCVVS